MTEARTQTSPAYQREGAERTRAGRVYTPRTDICEDEERILLHADMPGVDESGLEITLEKSVLTIRGSVAPQRHEGYEIAHVEYEPGDYERSFAIGREIDAERIEASIKNGVLRLVLPKTKPVQRRIQVAAG